VARHFWLSVKALVSLVPIPTHQSASNVPKDFSLILENASSVVETARLAAQLTETPVFHAIQTISCHQPTLV
jgi:hypothetical protein